jgi:hypothetical protein
MLDRAVSIQVRETRSQDVHFGGQRRDCALVGQHELGEFGTEELELRRHR